MVSDDIKDKYARDIMGRKDCSSIMPCGVCRAFNKGIPTYPEDYKYWEHMGKKIYI